MAPTAQLDHGRMDQGTLDHHPIESQVRFGYGRLLWIGGVQTKEEPSRFLVGTVLVVVALPLALSSLATPQAQADESKVPVRAGYLTCHVSRDGGSSSVHRVR
jgi:hypothetical protein